MKRVLSVGIVCLLLLGTTGCGSVDRLLNSNGKDPLGQLLNNKAAPTAGSKITPEESKSVLVYFADGAGKLAASEIQIPKTLSPARETLTQLLKGPQDSTGLQAVIPAGTSLLDINIKDATATVDLSQEFLKATKPELAVNSIVNTLTQFSTVKSVKIRVDGRTVNKLGSFNLGQTFTRDTSGVKKHPVTQQPVNSGDSTNSAAPIIN